MANVLLEVKVAVVTSFVYWMLDGWLSPCLLVYHTEISRSISLSILEQMPKGVVWQSTVKVGALCFKIQSIRSCALGLELFLSHDSCIYGLEPVVKEVLLLRKQSSSNTKFVCLRL